MEKFPGINESSRNRIVEYSNRFQFFNILNSNTNDSQPEINQEAEAAASL